MDLLPSAEQLEIAAAGRNSSPKECRSSRLRAKLRQPGRARASPRCGARAPSWDCSRWGCPRSSVGPVSRSTTRCCCSVELGRRLAPGPFLAGTLAARVVPPGGDAALAGGDRSGQRRRLALR